MFDHLSLDLPSAQWTCLLGRSGCGKTTLLRLICGLPVPGEPRYELTTSDAQPLSGRCAWMAQQDLLLPWLTVLNNVQLGLRLRGETLQPERALALLERVGLEHQQSKLPGELSGGMRQRVAIARTLMEDRPVCLLDEPFSNLDAITRHELQNLAGELLQGKTVCLVTHDPAEALRMGNHIHVFSGHSHQLQPPTELPGDTPRSLSRQDINSHTDRLLNQLSTNTSRN